MKTAVTQTSREAYQQLDLSHQQQEIIDALVMLEESCIADLAAYLNWERSTVAARLYELKPPTIEHPDRLGRIVSVGIKPSNRTGIRSEHWRVKHFSDGLF